MLQDKKKKLYQIKKNHINFFVLENKYPEIRKKTFYLGPAPKGSHEQGTMLPAFSLRNRSGLNM